MTFSTLASPGVSLQGGGGSGGGAASAPLTGTGATVTTSQPLIDVSQTWNNGAVTFTGLKFNAAGTSDANSAAASLLMDLQVGGASKFAVTKAGAATLTTQLYVSANGSAGTPCVRFGAVGLVGFYASSGAWCSVNAFGQNALVLNTGSGAGHGLAISSAGAYAFSNSATDATATIDLRIRRRAAANLQLGDADVGATTATVTITIAAPGVVTWSNHTLSTGTPVVFTTTGALPTGIVSGTTYYAVVVDANTFQIASSVANAIAATPTVITTSGSQSGTHTGTRYNITQRLSMQSNTGVTDRLGADLFIQGSQGTGTGAGGSIIFQVAPAGSSGSAQNALATALTIASNSTFTIGGTNPAIIGPGNTGRITFSDSNASLCYGGVNNTFGIALISPDGGSTTNLVVHSVGTIGFSSTSNANAAVDTILRRDAAGVMGLRGANTTTAAAMSFYSYGASPPTAPAASIVRLYADTSGGKIRLMAVFPTGVAQQIAIEP